MVLILPLISNYPILFSKPLGTIPSVPTTIGITITFLFHSLFSSLTRSKYLFNFLFILFLLYGPPVSFRRFLESFQVVQLQSVSPSLSCFTAFSALWQDPSICLIFSSFYFYSMVHQSLFEDFWNHSKCSNYNRYHHHFPVPQPFQLSGKIRIVFVTFFAFVLFSHYCSLEQ